MKLYIAIIIAPFLINTTYAQDKIRVIDRDIKDKGVECDISIEQKDGKVVKASYTNKKGYIEVDFTCHKLEKVIFIPKGDYYSETFKCPLDKRIVHLSSISYQRNLIANAKYLYSIGDYGSSALAYNDAAARLQRYDKSAALDASVKAYAATAKALGVQKPVVFDFKKQKEVMSPELKSAVTSFQKDKGLEQTGRIDFPTLRASSREELPAMLFHTPNN